MSTVTHDYVRTGDPARLTIARQEVESLIIERASVHPCTIDDFADLIPEKGRRYYKIQQLRQKGRLRFVGYYQNPTGRPQDVFCNSYWPQSLKHEVELTHLLLKYPFHIERGPDVDPGMKPDATVHHPNGDIWHIEYDTGTQSYAQVEKRWEVYKGCKDFVLIVTRRRDITGLMARMKLYDRVMHIARYDELRGDPFGKHIIDVLGGQFSFEKLQA